MAESSSKSPVRSLGYCAAGGLAVFAFLVGYAQLEGIVNQYPIALALLRYSLITACAIFPLLIAAVVGRRVLELIGLELGNVETLVFSCALGFGALSLFTFLTGWLVGLSQYLFLVVGITVCVVGHQTLIRCWEDLADLYVAYRQDQSLLLVPIAFVLFLTYLACFTPPLDYDVLEYHLGAPAYWLRDGRISFIEYIVYSNFPFNTEMLYLFPMVLTGDPLIGGLAGKLINFQLGMLCLAAIGAIASRFGGQQAGWVAVLVFVVCPWFTRSGVRAYDTFALSLFTLLAVHCLIQYACSGDIQVERKWLVVGAIFAGLAMGTKYPSFLFVWVPACVLVAVKAYIEKAGPQSLRQLAIICLIPIGLAAPWLIKNLVYTHNPVFPLLGGLFGGPQWDAEREARFVQAHLASPVGLLGLFKEFFKQFVAGDGSSPLLLVFLPFAFPRGQSRKALTLLAGYCAVFFLLWAYATHRIDRFLVPSFPMLSVLAGVGFSLVTGHVRFAARIVLVCFCLLHGLHILVMNGEARILSLDVLQGNAGGVVQSFQKGAYRAIDFMNRELGDEDRVLFVGEAQSYYCNRNYFLLSTVFDAQRLDNAFGREPNNADDPFTAMEVEAGFKKLKSLGVTHILVHWSECYRLQASYAFTVEGERRRGYLDCLPTPSTQPGVPDGARLQQFHAAAHARGGLFFPPIWERHAELVVDFAQKEEGEPPLPLYRLK